MEQVDWKAPAGNAPGAPRNRRKLLLAGGTVALAAAIAIAAAMLTGGKSHTAHITQQGYSDGPWPFTVAAVDIKCEDGSKELIGINGIDYALNDDARNAGFPGNFGPFWIDDTSAPGAKMPIYQLIMKATALC
jgi:hypothetical protein